MPVNVRYYGQITDITSCDSETIVFSGTTDELREWMNKRYPGLAAIRYTIAVNDRIANIPCDVPGNSTVALMPPFSGG